MTIYVRSRSPIHTLVVMLRAELAWYPGRPALVGRMVLACTSVMVIAMVFRITGAILGAGFPILISRENLKATRKTAFHIAVANRVAGAARHARQVESRTGGFPCLHTRARHRGRQ